MSRQALLGKKKIVVLLSGKLHNALWEYADGVGAKMSQVVRLALQEFLLGRPTEFDRPSLPYWEDEVYGELLNAIFGCNFELNEATKDVLKECLKTVPFRERRILELRFGLATGAYMTRGQTGAFLGLSYERVRQIETKALRRLRHPRYNRQIRVVLKPVLSVAE